MTFFQKAYAKINLSLGVLGKREDGYHEVAMLMHQISLFDTVSLSLHQTKGIHLSTDSSQIPTDERNIAYRAAKLLLEEFSIDQGVDIHIEKKIPVAGGLAGGSTDAAAILRLLNEALNLNLSKSDLMKLGLKLGADVPYCIFSAPALAEGIGEKLTQIVGLPKCQILIVNPGIEISTKEIYEMMDSYPERTPVDNVSLIAALKDGDLQKASEFMINQMQPVASTKCKKIPEIIRALKRHGAIHAMMSGSGATCFGIFSDNVELAEVQKAFPDMISCITLPHYSK